MSDNLDPPGELVGERPVLHDVVEAGPDRVHGLLKELNSLGHLGHDVAPLVDGLPVPRLVGVPAVVSQDLDDSFFSVFSLSVPLRMSSTTCGLQRLDLDEYLVVPVRESAP